MESAQCQLWTRPSCIINCKPERKAICWFFFKFRAKLNTSRWLVDSTLTMRISYWLREEIDIRPLCWKLARQSEKRKTENKRKEEREREKERSELRKIYKRIFFAGDGREEGENNWFYCFLSPLSLPPLSPPSLSLFYSLTTGYLVSACCIVRTTHLATQLFPFTSITSWLER